MRHHSWTSLVIQGVLLFALIYLLPVGVMAAAVHLGWHADPPAQTSAIPMLAGDGVIESGWDCATMGNLVCGEVIA